MTSAPQTRVLAIDIDGHLTEPDSIWSEYLPDRYRDAAPRRVVDTQGHRRLVIGDQTFPYIDATVQHHNSAGTMRSDAPAGSGFDPRIRLSVMDSEGVEAMILFPTTGLNFGGILDLDVQVALCRAYNDWAADFCKADPSRLIAHALVPQLSVRATRDEIERAVGTLGMRGVFLRPNPIGRALDDPAWEPVWSLIEECDVPLGFHEGTNGAIPQFGYDRSESYLFRHMMSHPYEHMAAMLSMICGGIMERHPGLRVSFLEAGCGWVPYWVERMEHHLREFGSAIELSLTPTEYLNRQCLVSTDSDEGRVLPAYISCLGASSVAWSTDFPHPDHEWKGMVSAMMDRTDLAPDTKRSVIGRNAQRFYRLDL